MSTISMRLLWSLRCLITFVVLRTIFPRSLAMNEDYASPMKNPYIRVMMQAPQMSLVPPDDVLDFFRDQYPLPGGLQQPLSEYDYVIVGAGSAGSVLAARLSEDKSTSVLLLEAGKPETLFTETPILAPYFQLTPYTWQYTMERQENVCKGFVDGVCFWPRGRAVGGTSVINYMIYTRGFAEDWDRIAADGNYGWSYDEVLPYFLKSEGANLKKWKQSPYHNTSGELSVQDVPFRSRLAKAFLAAGKELGHRIVDYNSRDGFGFSHIQATMNRGHRHSAAKAFLHDNKKRKNLHVLPEARAFKVLIDKQTKTAHAVEYLWKKKRHVVKAKREIILSAGPLASPQLLMLSGVGPSDQLQKFNIPVIQNLNVGTTLYDHISLPGLTFVTNTSRLTTLLKNIIHYRNSVTWFHYGDGPFSTLAGVETIGYIKTNISKESGEYPDIELLGSCGSLASDLGTIVRRGIRLSDKVYNTVYKPLENIEAFSIFPMLLHPKSKGYMQLRDKNPLSQPRFYGNYLTHPDDIATLIAAIRYIIRLTETNAYQRFGTRLHSIPFPGCTSYIFNSDGYWECVLRSMTATLHHQIATCKMGPRSDPDAVVDPELRVHGIHRLRVADTGIIPRTLCAHTNAPGIMIGEKAADLIKQTWSH